MPNYLVAHTTTISGKEFVVVDEVDALTKDLAFEYACDILSEKIANGEVDIATIKVL